MKRLKLATTISLILAGSISQVSAEEANKSEEKSNFEVIEVTAQKRTQNIQNVPIAVQAFSEDSIEKLGAAFLNDLTKAAPSFQSAGKEGSGSRMGIRGVIDYSRNIGFDARTGVYIDGVFQGRSYSANQPLIGLGSVEILRGPQGTLFGKNTVSGAINLTTKEASEDFEAVVGLEVGNYNKLNYSVYLNGGIAENLYGSFSYADSSNDGWFDNLTTGDTWGKQENDIARMELRWQATDALEFILRADKGHTFNTQPIATLGDQPAHSTLSTFQDEDVLDFSGQSVTVNYDFANGYTFTSITAQRDTEAEIYDDNDMLPFDMVQDMPFGEIHEQFTQEIRLVSPKYDNYDWVAGLYYYSSNTASNRLLRFGPDLINMAGLVPTIGLFDPALADRVAANPGFAAGYMTIPSDLDNVSKAAYIHGNYRINEQLELTGGLRYTVENKDMLFSQVNEQLDPALAADVEGLFGLLGAPTPFTQFPGAAFGGLNIPLTELDRSVSDLSPTIGLNYKPADDQMVYAKISKAFKSGGWNADYRRSSGLNGIEFDDESVINTEIGYKSTLLNDTLRFNATWFQSKFDDFQIFQFTAFPDGTSGVELTNAGEATSQGFEVETQWFATENLSISLNAMFLDAAYDKFDNISILDDGSELIQDFAGNSLEFAPDSKYYVDATYNMELNSGDLVLSIDYSYTSDSYSNANNFADNNADGELDYHQPSYFVSNARATYFAQSGGWSASLWVKNLTDEEYTNNVGLSFLQAPRVNWEPPRTFGLTFKMLFD